MKCPFCGTVNQPGEQFCSNCGGYLAATAPTAADATVISTNPGASSAPISTTVTTGGNTTGGGGGARTLTVNMQLQHGRYVVEKVLGQGGMGAAVLAKDTRVANKRVVIKELVSDNTDPAKRQEDVRNFEREVETLANLDHPLIPNVTDSFQEGSHYFMVQEYAAGENLEDHMERVNQPMPEKEALNYASQVLDILDYLSLQKPPIIHRDIKPANIIIGSKDNRARLVDFGIARADVAKNAKHKQTSALGTPGYAPPEQYQGNADARSDLYALAATLHHVLTNRDPRNYPPFTYPPARTLNPQLSPDIERVLERALTLDVNKRYQNAAAMKHDIDDILARRFGSSGDTSNYTLRTSGPMVATPATSATIPSRPAPQAVPPPPPRAYPQPSQQQQVQQQRSRVAAIPQQPTPAKKRETNWVSLSFIGLIVVALLIGGLVFAIPRLRGGQSTASTATSTSGGQQITPAGGTPSSNSNPISVQTIGSEVIGISDGTTAFDTNRADGPLKQQAADKLKQGDTGGALSLLSQAISTESNDGEALIYKENLRIAASPHITFVVGAMPSGANTIVGVSRDTLQGAYLAQKEFNDGNKIPGLKVRLLIASSGGDQKNATLVAQQIVQLAKTDPTFVGVMGWPYSGLTFAATQVLGQAQIPMVSSTASADDLTGISSYFFRVAPPDKSQGIAGAKYAEKQGYKNAAVFADPSNLYSQGLAADFKQQFEADGNKVVAMETYTVNKPETIQPVLTDALKQNPDLIYFAGYSNDVGTLLKGLVSAGTPDTLHVLGGDALYELSGYNGSTAAERSRLRFTAFSYPDEWDVAGLTAQKPAFFTEYASTLSGGKKGYGLDRPTNDAMLSYDAMTALLKAAAATGKTSMKPTDLQQALTTTAFQGVSGYIKFGPDGNPINKAFVVLKVEPAGTTDMDQLIGSLTPSA